MGDEQRFKALVEGRVTGAGLIQKSPAGDTGLQFDGSAEQRFLAFLW